MLSKIILDDSLPVNVRKFIYERHRALVKAETDLVKAETETIVAKAKIESLTKLLEKAQLRLNCMNPRAVLEYVDYWVMPHELSREERWRQFILETEIGRDMGKCIHANKQWIESTLAKRSVGTHTIDSIHKQSHDIHTRQKVALEKLKRMAEAYSITSCMVKVLDLKIDSAYHRWQDDDRDKLS